MAKKFKVGKRGYKKRARYSRGKKLKVNYFDEFQDHDLFQDQPALGPSLAELDLINLVTSTFYEEAITSENQRALCKCQWLKGRENKHTILFTSDQINDRPQSPEWRDGLRSLPLSTIKPARQWWNEETSQVVTSVNYEKSSDIPELPAQIERELEEAIVSQLEEIEKEGSGTKLSDDFILKMVKAAKIDYLCLSTAFAKRCIQGFIEGRVNPLNREFQLRGAIRDAFGYCPGDISSSSDEAEKN